MLGYDELRYFLKVADTGSLRQAAQSLNLSQPGLSYTIKKMEDHLGVSLLLRSSKGVVLTKAGEIFFEKATRMLEAWEDLNCELVEDSNIRNWLMTIGCHPSVGIYALPLFVPGLLERFPSLRINLKHGLSGIINNQVVDSQIDLGLVINPFPRPELIIRPVTGDVISLWESTENKNRETLIYDPALAQSQWILRKIAKEGVRFNRFIESGHLGVIASLTRSGAGVGVLPARVIGTEGIRPVYERKRIIFHDSLCLVYRPEFKKKNKSREILKVITGAFKQCPPARILDHGTTA